MADTSPLFSIGEKSSLLLQSSMQMTEKDDYDKLLEIYQNLYVQISVANNCEINEVFLKSLDHLMTSAEQHIHNASTPPDFYSSIVQCVTSCLRVCRNLCAICKSNQAIFHNSGKFVIQMKSLLSELQAREHLTEEELVLLRCAVQFLCNYASGNVENQWQVWVMFQDLLLWCLESHDEKLQSYTQMGIHICLCDSTSRMQEKVNAHLCWNILHRCIQLAMNEEAVNGLLVIEDALRLPGFCENVFPRLENGLKILVLEVLINQLEKIPDEGSDPSPKTCDIPCTSNIQYLAADFVVQAHHIPNMTADSPNDSKALYIVKELESLCLASVHHGLYSCLQEMHQLVKVSISLLQSIEDLGSDGNPMFANADKMADLVSIDQEHPVFGLKRDLIRLLGNLAYKNKQNQDIIREENGIPLILNKTNIDGKNPFIIQWSVLAIHNLTENNVENQKYIADLKLEGVANNQAVLEEMGLMAEKEGEKVVIKKKRLS